jgi:hypothetical protein
MKRTGFFLALITVLIVQCKDKNGDNDTNDASAPFPVLSYLQSQVKHVDTSLYSIVKISKAHGRLDTAYLRREDFEAAAHDFLSLPDISSKKLRKKYSETKLYDEDLKKVVITYAPKDKEDFDEITRQDVIIDPGEGANDQVQTIYIETVLNKGDSTVQKRMTWNVDKDFQVIRITNKNNSPEDIQTTDVSWLDHR